MFVRVEWEVVKRGLSGGNAGGTGREIVDWDDREEDDREESAQDYELEEEIDGDSRGGQQRGVGGYGMNGYSGGGSDSGGPFDVVFETDAEGQDGKARMV